LLIDITYEKILNWKRVAKGEEGGRKELNHLDKIFLTASGRLEKFKSNFGNSDKHYVPSE